MGVGTRALHFAMLTTFALPTVVEAASKRPPHEAAEEQAAKVGSTYHPGAIQSEALAPLPGSKVSTSQYRIDPNGNLQQVKEYCPPGTVAKDSLGRANTLWGQLSNVANAAEPGRKGDAPYLMGYSDSPEVQKMIKYLMDGAAKSDFWCYREVKKGLEYGGLVDNFPYIDKPRHTAPPWLEHMCFINVMQDFPTPSSAPVGAVLVYDGACPGERWNDWGHIEVRTEKGYVSDYYSRVARSDATDCRRLKGVYIKPNPNDHHCRKGGSK